MTRLYRLALLAAAAAYALIVLSGVSRITDGRLDAPWIVESLHRAGALITVAAVLVVAAGTLIAPAISRRTRITAWSALVMVAIQIGLGAIAEWRDFPAGVATAALAAALLCAAATMLTAYFVALDRGGPIWLTQAGALRATGPDHRDRGFLAIAQLAAAAVLVLILSGAATSSSGATLACTAWPLCQEGRVLPDSADSGTWLNLSHRGVALIGMVTVSLIAIAAVRRGASPFVQRLAFAACAVILLQSLVGALYVTTDLDSPWLGGLHLGLAALLWAMTVSIAIVARRSWETVETEVGKTGRQEERRPEAGIGWFLLASALVCRSNPSGCRPCSVGFSRLPSVSPGL